MAFVFPSNHLFRHVLSPSLWKEELFLPGAAGWLYKAVLFPLQPDAHLMTPRYVTRE